MAEKKITRADGTVTTAKVAKPVHDKGSAAGFRVGAAIAWLFAIGFEVVAVLILFGKINLTFMPTLAQLIVALVLDLACVITGSLLWKKANRIDPASKKNKVKFWLWNNMGLIVCAFAFIPFVILALTNKEADKKTKTIAAVVAIIALLIGGLVSYDWNPVSQEDKAAAIDALEGRDVYWSPFGSVYHTDPECSHLNRSDSLTVGSAEQAIEAGRERLCKTCAAKENIVIDTERAAEDAPDAESEEELTDDTELDEEVLDEAEEAA